MAALTSVKVCLEHVFKAFHDKRVYVILILSFLFPKRSLLDTGLFV